jgi:methionyl-tRNA formyltransferase
MRHNTPVLTSGLLKASTLPSGVDLIIAAHSHDFISDKTRQKTVLGAIGYHPSLLPVHRGRDAIAWAIRMRDRITGGSVFWLNDKIDAGDIAAQKHVFIHPKDTPETLWRTRLFPLGIELLGRVLSDLANGVIVAIPQDDSLATWEPSIGRPPIYRPDLPQLGAPPSGFTVVKRDNTLSGFISDEIKKAHNIA